MDGPRVWVLGGTEGNVVKLSAVNQVQGGEVKRREVGGVGAREEVTLQQHLDTAKGSWRMAPGVSAESRRIRGGITVRNMTSTGFLFVR